MFSFLTKLFKQTPVKSETHFPGVVIGKITKIEAHPNADRLRLATVDIGHELRLVCGAPNLVLGKFAPVALIGAQLPNGVVIQKAMIRGVESEGMICAEDELGLGNNHSGVILFDQAQIGDVIDSYLQK